jgi:tetrapyrrole methylase family protein/MazG family protein
MSDAIQKRDKRGIDRLLEVVARLRGEGGCPWDREQTIDSLKQYLIEESYEVIDAIESGDSDKHAEELGDVLLQIALHARIREEQGEFNFDDVADRLADKLIRRHPHVFGDVSVKDSAGVLRNWEIIKANEKGSDRKSVLDGVPKQLPALQKAQRIQSRVARVGFDWPDTRDVVAKVDEELAETKEAIAGGDREKVHGEIGDLLFAIVNLCRFEKVEAEECLRASISKFERRFREIEKRVKKEGRELKDCTLAELDAHWNAIKKKNKNRPNIKSKRPNSLAFARF